MRAYQAALITAAKSAALYASTVQQTSTSVTSLTGEHQQVLPLNEFL